MEFSTLATPFTTYPYQYLLLKLFPSQDSGPFIRTNKEAMTTCYVGNIAWATTNADLESTFSSAGALSVELQIHADSGRTKGWALVHFSTPEQAQAFVASYNLFTLHDRGQTLQILPCFLPSSFSLVNP